MDANYALARNELDGLIRIAAVGRQSFPYVFQKVSSWEWSSCVPRTGTMTLVELLQAHTEGDIQSV